MQAREKRAKQPPLPFPRTYSVPVGPQDPATGKSWRLRVSVCTCLLLCTRAPVFRDYNSPKEHPVRMCGLWGGRGKGAEERMWQSCGSAVSCLWKKSKALAKRAGQSDSKVCLLIVTLPKLNAKHVRGRPKLAGTLDIHATCAPKEMPGGGGWTLSIASSPRHQPWYTSRCPLESIFVAISALHMTLNH